MCFMLLWLGSHVISANLYSQLRFLSKCIQASMYHSADLRLQVYIDTLLHQSSEEKHCALRHNHTLRKHTRTIMIYFSCLTLLFLSALRVCVWVCGTYQHTRFHGPMAVRYSCSNQGDRTDSSDLVCCVYSSHMWPRWWSQCSCSGLSDRYTHSLIVRQRETADKYLEVIQKKGIYQSSTHVIFLLFGGGTSYWEQPVSGEELAIREGTHVHPERDNLCKGRDPGEDWPYPERWHRQFWTAGWTLALLESISSGLLWTQKRCITIAACRL